MGDLGGERLVVHQQKVELPNVADKELLEAVGKEMASLFVAAVADLGHSSLTLEATPDPVIDTLGLPPCLLHAVVAVRLMAFEFVGPLLDDLDGHCGL